MQHNETVPLPSHSCQNQIDCALEPVYEIKIIFLLEIRSVERGICPIRESIMTDTVINGHVITTVRISYKTREIRRFGHK